MRLSQTHRLGIIGKRGRRLAIANDKPSVLPLQWHDLTQSPVIPDMRVIELVM